MTRAFAIILMVGFSSALRGEELSPALETGPCSLARAAPAAAAVVDDDVDLLLDDGKRVALAGLEFPQGDGDAAALRARATERLSAWLPAVALFVEPLAASPDRWGHVPAFAIAAASSERESALVSVGATLLAEGLARFRPDPAAAGCAAVFLAAEAPARRAKRGVWAIDPVVDLSNPSGLAELAHRKGMVVVSGIVHSVGETKTAYYLNFGERRSEDFAVVISKRNNATISGNSAFPRALAGRRIGVRGLIDWNSGPRIEISVAGQIDLGEADAR
ncbi:MAG TPA: nuclease [Methylocystis sp.]|nr:nuclease [Methylocystis sp.]